MSNFKYLIFLITLLMHFANCTSDADFQLSNQDKEDIRITKKAVNILNQIEKKILIKEHKIDESEFNKEESENDEKSDDQSNLYQGDIVFTKEQAQEMVNQIVKEAEEKGVDISDIDINI